MANNNMKKVIAAMLAVSMMASQAGVSVFAESLNSFESTTVGSGSGTIEDPLRQETITTATQTNPENGEIITETTEESEWSGSEQTPNGSSSVEGGEQSESTLVTDSEGNVLEGSGSTEGFEVKVEITTEQTEEESEELDPVQQGEAEVTEGDESEMKANGDFAAVGDEKQIGREQKESKCDPCPAQI